MALDLLLVVVSMSSVGRAEATVPAITSSKLLQRGAHMEFVIRTTSMRPLSQSTLLCMRELSGSGRPLEDVCLRRNRQGRAFVQLRRLAPIGAVLAKRPLPARIERRKRGYAVTFLLSDAHIGQGPLRWQAFAASVGAPCSTPGCASRQPPSGAFSTRIRAVEGCRPRGESFRRGGPRAAGQVALTFDDGPSSDTPAFLRVLERENVQATFFLIGNYVAGNRDLLTRMLAEGHVLGNHTTGHQALPGAGNLAHANSIIRGATGYSPCLFRPPYGAVNGSVIGAARSLGMLTIAWNVDPSDYALPGAAAIVSRTMSQVRSGSIVLLHDGGGPRGQALAALPYVIHALRSRGYELVTVPQLLGLEPAYRSFSSLRSVPRVIFPDDVLGS